MSPPKFHTFEGIGVEFARRLREAERRFVGAGWFDPVGFNNACFEHGITGDVFADAQVRFIAAYIVGCADVGLVPSIRDLLWCAQRQRFLLSELTMLDILTDADPFAIDRLVRELIDLKRRQTQALKLLRQARQLLSEGTKPDLAPHSRISVRISSGVARRLQKGVRHAK